MEKRSWDELSPDEQEERMVWRDLILYEGYPSISPMTASGFETAVGECMITFMSAFSGRSIGNLKVPSFGGSNEKREEFESVKLASTRQVKLDPRPADLSPDSPLIGIRFR